jgi:hypothetical protein
LESDFEQTRGPRLENRRPRKAIVGSKDQPHADLHVVDFSARRPADLAKGKLA